MLDHEGQSAAPHHERNLHGVRNGQRDADDGMLLSRPQLAHRHNRRHEPQSSPGQQGLTARRKGTEDFGTAALTPIKHMTTSCQGDETHKLCQCDGFNVNYGISSMCYRVLLVSPEQNSGRQHTWKIAQDIHQTDVEPHSTTIEDGGHEAP